MVEQWRPIKQKFDEMYERFIEHIEQRGVEIPDSGILAGPVCPVRPMIEAGQIRWTWGGTTPISRWIIVC